MVDDGGTPETDDIAGVELIPEIPKIPELDPLSALGGDAFGTGLAAAVRTR